LSKCCDNKNKLIKLINVLVEELQLGPTEKAVVNAGIAYVYANITEEKAARIIEALKKAIKNV